MSGYADPKNIHFQADQFRVQRVEQKLKTGGAVHRFKFERVVVIAEAEAGGAAFFACFVELLSQRLHLV